MTISASAGIKKSSPQVAADDFVLAHFKRSAVAGTHVIGRMVAQNRGYWTFLVLLLVGLKDFPQVARRRMQRGAILRFDFHAVIGTVIYAALGVLADSGHGHVGTAVHLVMPHDRKVIEIDIISYFDVFFDRR